MASAPQKEFGGRMFSFGFLSATEAIRVQVPIMKVIGEPLFRAFTALKKSKDNGEIDETAPKLTSEEDIAAVSAAIGLMMARMDAEEMLAVAAKVFAVTSCDGKPILMDTTFAGRPKELWAVFMEALRVNFADFFPAGLSASLANVLPT